MKKSIKFLASSITAILFIGSIALVSCVKDGQVINNEHHVSSFKSSGNSPFDYIGETHNQLLSLIGTEIENDITDFVNLKYKTEESRDSLIEKIVNVAPHIVKEIVFADMTMSEIEDLFESTYIAAEQDEYVLSEVAIEIKKIFDRYQGVSDLDELQLDIRMTELDMVNREMSAIDSQIVACLNIYYHSLNFWKDATLNEENPWHVLIDDINNNPDSYLYNATKRPRIKEWLKKAGEWLHNTYQHIKEKYTWKNIGLADLYGAGLGANLAINTPAGANAIIISAVAMSTVGPLFM